MNEHAHLLRILDAARALHERDDSDPQYCTTCGDINTATGQWPCPTATTLGATGRAEWTNTTTETATCQSTHPRYPEALNPQGHHRYPCIRHTEHTGPHRDGDGDTW